LGGKSSSFVVIQGMLGGLGMERKVWIMRWCGWGSEGVGSWGFVRYNGGDGGFFCLMGVERVLWVEVNLDGRIIDGELCSTGLYL
jgi:hypothetical protein